MWDCSIRALSLAVLASTVWGEALILYDGLQCVGIESRPVVMFAGASTPCTSLGVSLVNAGGARSFELAIDRMAGCTYTFWANQGCGGIPVKTVDATALQCGCQGFGNVAQSVQAVCTATESITRRNTTMTGETDVSVTGKRSIDRRALADWCPSLATIAPIGMIMLALFNLANPPADDTIAQPPTVIVSAGEAEAVGNPLGFTTTEIDMYSAAVQQDMAAQLQADRTLTTMVSRQLLPDGRTLVFTASTFNPTVLYVLSEFYWAIQTRMALVIMTRDGLTEFSNSGIFTPAGFTYEFTVQIE